MKLKYEANVEEEEKIEPMVELKVEFNDESNNSTIVKTVKKKSFLKSFISPDRPKLDSEIYEERQPLSPPPRIKENPELYKIERIEKAPKISVNVKRALINNSKINNFFQVKKQKLE